MSLTTDTSSVDAAYVYGGERIAESEECNIPVVIGCPITTENVQNSLNFKEDNDELDCINTLSHLRKRKR